MNAEVKALTKIARRDLYYSGSREVDEVLALDTTSAKTFDLPKVPDSQELDPRFEQFPVGLGNRTSARNLGQAWQDRGDRRSVARTHGALRRRRGAGTGDRRACRHGLRPAGVRASASISNRR